MKSNVVVGAADDVMRVVTGLLILMGVWMYVARKAPSRATLLPSPAQSTQGVNRDAAR